MSQTVKTYAVRRRIKVGSEYRGGPGKRTDPVTVEHLVPEAHLWRKAESLLHTGWLQEVKVPVEDLFAAFELRQLSSSDCLAVLGRLGLQDGVSALGAHRSPRAAPSRPQVTREHKTELAPDTNPGPGQFRNRRRPVKAAKAPVKKSPAKAPAEKTKTKPTTTGRKRANTAVLIPMREVTE